MHVCMCTLETALFSYYYCCSRKKKRKNSQFLNWKKYMGNRDLPIPESNSRCLQFICYCRSFTDIQSHRLNILYIYICILCDMQLFCHDTHSSSLWTDQTVLNSKQCQNGNRHIYYLRLLTTTTTIKIIILSQPIEMFETHTQS